MSTVQSTISDVHGLHDKLDRKRTVERHNEQCQTEFQGAFNSEINRLEQELQAFVQAQRGFHTDRTHKIGRQLKIVQIYTVLMLNRRCYKLLVNKNLLSIPWIELYWDM